jgi:GT2 family glycosyltransferase
MVEILESRPHVGALGPRLRYEDGAVQMSFGRMLSFTSEFLQKCWNAAYARGKGPLRRFVEQMSSREREVDWVSGACLLTRRDVLETISGFDENFFLYSEDVDLCARIRSTGASVLFTPDVEIVHLLGRSARKERDLTLLESQRSRLYFYAKHYGFVRVSALRAYIAIKAAIGYVFRPKSRTLYRSVLDLALGGMDS